jgi:hypothetical protein
MTRPHVLAFVLCAAASAALPAVAEPRDSDREMERVVSDARQAAETARQLARQARQDAMLAAEEAQDVVQEALEAAAAGIAAPSPAREIVKNAPFSADVIHETRQTLADGNRIVRRTQTAFARDSMGRTRQERSTRTIVIDDPVAGRRYVLQPERKSAVRLPRFGQPLIAPGTPLGPLPPAPAAPPSAPMPRDARMAANV